MMRYLSSVNLVSRPLHVLGIFIAHQQEVHHIYIYIYIYIYIQQLVLIVSFS